MFVLEKVNENWQRTRKAYKIKKKQIFFWFQKWMILSPAKLRQEVVTGVEQQQQQLFACVRPHHASRGGRGSMGGYAPAGPQSEPRLSWQCDCFDNNSSSKCSIVRTSWPATSCLPDNQTHEEPSQHHEAVQPHQARLHDQHCCEQAGRWAYVFFFSSRFVQLRKNNGTSESSYH